MSAPRAVGLVAGFVADRLLGDPARLHPVAGFGAVAGRLEARVWADRRQAGAAYAVVLVGGALAGSWLVERAAARRPEALAVTTAVVTWGALGGRSLGREAAAVEARLARGDLPAARQRLTHLVGRDTDGLGSGEVARAVVESVAENTSDAVVAPLVAGAVAGVPGLVCYRAVNTLDAMVGHRDPRYRNFGWAPARLDDLLNLAPARLSAGLAVLLAPAVGGVRADALRAWRRDARHHPSPNAGPVEAAFAGALGVRLGGVNSYRDRTEDRHTLGHGRAPGPQDIARTVRLADRVAVGALAVSALWAARRPRPRRRPGR
jgi:adenosylcobinamide-phosphate synthase